MCIIIFFTVSLSTTPIFPNGKKKNKKKINLAKFPFLSLRVKVSLDASHTESLI